MDNDNSNDRGFGEIAEREIPEGEEQETTTDEQVDDDSSDSRDTRTNGTDDQETDDQDNEEEGEDDSQEPTQKTEKGTKLDPNPKSAVHQQLANERRVRTQMEQVLADPKLIARFVKEQYGVDMPLPGQAAPQGQQDQGQQSTVTTKKWTAKDFENIEDVADKFNELQESFTQTMSQKDEEIKALRKEIGGIQQGSRLERVADTLQSDVSSLRALPELNPKNPAFIEGLEDEIGEEYHRLDFDENMGMYRGDYSLKEIGERMIRVARKARKAGVQQGQTIVRDKSGGRVRTSPAVNGQADSENLPPGQSIAQGIAKMFKN